MRGCVVTMRYSISTKVAYFCFHNILNNTNIFTLNGYRKCEMNSVLYQLTCWTSFFVTWFPINSLVFLTTIINHFTFPTVTITLHTTNTTCFTHIRCYSLLPVFFFNGRFWRIKSVYSIQLTSVHYKIVTVIRYATCRIFTEEYKYRSVKTTLYLFEWGIYLA